MRNKILERLNKINAQANARTLGASEEHVLGGIPMPWWYALYKIHSEEEFYEFWDDVVKNIAGKPQSEMFVTEDVFRAMIWGDDTLWGDDTPSSPNVSFNWDSIPLYTIITCLPFGYKAIQTARGIAPITEKFYDR